MVRTHSAGHKAYPRWPEEGEAHRAAGLRVRDREGCGAIVSDVVVAREHLPPDTAVGTAIGDKKHGLHTTFPRVIGYKAAGVVGDVKARTADHRIAPILVRKLCERANDLAALAVRRASNANSSSPPPNF